MHDAHQLCAFFSGASLEEKTEVLLEVCSRDPELLLAILRDISKPEWEAEVIEFLRAQQKINAIKLWRNKTGVGLKDAKDAVEELQQRLGL